MDNRNWNPPAGITIDMAAELMVTVANADNCVVHAKFNDTPITAHPGDAAAEIVNHYYTERSRVQPDELVNGACHTTCDLLANELRVERDRLRAALGRATAALNYAGVGNPYPHDRLGDLIKERQSCCVSDDDRTFWHYVREKLLAVAADPDATAAAELWSALMANYVTETAYVKAIHSPESTARAVLEAFVAHANAYDTVTRLLGAQKENSNG